jgi:glutathione S-transferase
MKLIGSTSSPYVRKVRIVLADKKLDYEFTLEDVWSAHSIIQEHNPLGKIPCLIVDDKEALFDSRVLAEYLDTLSPVSRLIPQSGRERAYVKCLEALCDGTNDALIAVRLERQRPVEQQNPDWVNRQLSKVNASLLELSHKLGEQSFFTGINYSLADISAGCLLGYLEFRFSEIDWRGSYPNLDTFYKKMMSRQAFIDTLPT